jgi:OmpA-OmpF porin, OOP family
MKLFKSLFVITACTLVAVPASLVWAQQATAPQAVSEAKAGGVSAPLGEVYKAPKPLTTDVTRLTVYRPAVGFGVGVASLDINGHYHSSLQLGGFTHLCLKPAKGAVLASRLVETGVPMKNEADIETSVLLTPKQELYVRLADQGNGRATIEVVSPDTAAKELANTQLQVHAASRVPDAASCDAPVVAAPVAAPVAKKLETITLASDALFAFGKSDASAIPAGGRASLDKLIDRLVKQYGSFEQTQIQVIGYADPLGNPVSNKRLSDERADAIKGYMVQGGIASTKIVSEGRGATELIVSSCARVASPASIECNKPNRRVVVTVLVTEQR